MLNHCPCWGLSHHYPERRPWSWCPVLSTRLLSCSPTSISHPPNRSPFLNQGPSFETYPLLPAVPQDHVPGTSFLLWMPFQVPVPIVQLLLGSHAVTGTLTTSPDLCLKLCFVKPNVQDATSMNFWIVFSQMSHSQCLRLHLGSSHHLGYSLEAYVCHTRKGETAYQERIQIRVEEDHHD